MNSARIRWSRRSSDTSSITSQTPRLGDRRARTTSVGPSSRAEGQLAARLPALPGRPGDRLDGRVDEGLDRAPPDERPGRPPEELVGGEVGDVDPQVVVEADDADADDVEQGGPVALDLGRGPLGGLGPIEQDPDALLDVDAFGVDRDGLIVAGPGQELADAVEGPAPDDGQGDRDPQRDRLDDDERDHQRVHARSMAHAPVVGWPRPDGLELGAVGVAGEVNVRVRIIPREERFFDMFVEDSG